MARTARLQELASFLTETRGLTGLLQIGIAHGLVNERNGDVTSTAGAVKGKTFATTNCGIEYEMGESPQGAVLSLV